MDKILCVIAAHSSDELSIKSTCSNIKYFKEISDKIVIVNSKEFVDYDPLKKCIAKQYGEKDIEFHYCANLISLNHGKWIFYIDNIYKHDYEHVILTNDTFLVIDTLIPFIELHHSKEHEMTGLISSREGSWHCQDFLRVYNNEAINKAIAFYKEQNILNGLFLDVTDVDATRFQEAHKALVQSEISSCQIHSHQSCLYTMPLTYKKNLNFDNEKLKEYIEEKGYPIIKHRKMHLTEYKRKMIPKDFNPQEYKSVNTDLQFQTEKELTEHFKNHGLHEGRLYKKNQKINLPEYIEKAIEGELNAELNQDTEFEQVH